MTAVRTRGNGGWSDEILVITDPDGDTLTVDRLVANSRDDLVLLSADSAVRLGLDDAIALLSFLADSAGVERFIPGDSVPPGDIADT